MPESTRTRFARKYTRSLLFLAVLVLIVWATLAGLSAAQAATGASSMVATVFVVAAALAVRAWSDWTAAKREHAKAAASRTRGPDVTHIQPGDITRVVDATGRTVLTWYSHSGQTGPLETSYDAATGRVMLQSSVGTVAIRYYADGEDRPIPPLTTRTVTTGLVVA